MMEDPGQGMLGGDMLCPQVNGRLFSHCNIPPSQGHHVGLNAQRRTGIPVATLQAAEPPPPAPPLPAFAAAPQYGSVRSDICAFDSIEQAVVICYVASTAVCRAVVVYEQGAQRAGWMPVPSVQAVLTCASQRRLPAQLLQLRDGVRSTGLLHVAAAFSPLCPAPSPAPRFLAGLDGCSAPIAVLKKDTPRRDNSFASPGVYTSMCVFPWPAQGSSDQP